ERASSLQTLFEPLAPVVGDGHHDQDQPDDRQQSGKVQQIHLSSWGLPPAVSAGHHWGSSVLTVPVDAKLTPVTVRVQIGCLDVCRRSAGYSPIRFVGGLRGRRPVLYPVGT